MTGRCDGLFRARRERDSFTPGVPLPGGIISAPSRDLLPVGDGDASAQPVALDEYGTTVISTSIDGAAWAGRTIRFTANTERGKVRYRVFRVDSGAGGTLTPAPMCVATADRECVTQLVGGDQRPEVNVVVPIGPNTQEVLLIASGGDTSSAFSWMFGDVNARLEIISPNRSQRAFIGHPTTERQSALVAFAARDADNLPLAVSADDLTVTITGCAQADCTLTYTDNGDDSDDDFTFLPLSGGNYYLIVNVPDGFYPNGSGTLGLEIAAAGFDSASEPDSLEFDDSSSRTTATVLVLDKSGSMDGEKMDALKIASKALVQAMVPVDGGPATHQLGLVSYNDDADTTLGLVPVTDFSTKVIGAIIDTLAASGWTSIGDGVLEGQSVLASAFDDPAAVAPTVQAMVVVSDGLSNYDAHPSVYYKEKSNPINDGRGDDWESTSLTWEARKSDGKVLPVISTIAIGQDADLWELEELSRLSGTEPLVLPGAGVDGADFAAAMAGLTDAFLSSHNEASGHRRVLTASSTEGKVLGGGNDPSSLTIPVESGASELRVTVSTDWDRLAAIGNLISPSGVWHSANSSDDSGEVKAYRIPNPEQGKWTYRGGRLDHGTIFVEAALMSPLTLYASADPADLERGEATPRVGTEMVIRAVPFETRALPDCNFGVWVTSPNGTTETMGLYDDGKHDDGAANDGVYARRYTKTSAAGAYDVRIVTRCPRSGGTHAQREKSLSMYLKPAVDSDQDGMPDWWERRHGLPIDKSNPNTRNDADGDGLTDWQEFYYGTNPQEDDTDFGGENDKSEVRRGSDPLSADDDSVSKPHLTVLPGNAKIVLSFDMTTIGLDTSIERSDDGGQSWVDVAPTPAGDGVPYTIDSDITNGTEVCYRARIADSSAWSPLACATPDVDPFAPSLESIGEVSTTCGGAATVSFRVGDDRLGRHSNMDVELGTKSSAIDEMRVWFGNDDAPNDSHWEPLAADFSVIIPSGVSTISVEASDAAGNVSNVLRLGVSSGCPDTPLGRAMTLEEEAKRLLAQEDWEGARELVAESIPEIESALQDAFQAIASQYPPRAEDVDVAGKLLRVLLLKKTTLALLLDPSFCSWPFGEWYCDVRHHKAGHKLDGALHIENHIGEQGTRP